MGSLKDPKTWIPHINPKDCSQKVCNIYCTKWCKYIILPSPPQPSPLVKVDFGGTTLSPVVILIIALTGCFLLLIAYYFVFLRFCTRNNTESSLLLRRDIANQEIHDPEMGVDGGDQENDHSNYVPWIVIGKGLDEASIKSITRCKYKKGDGLVTCTDCSVCLGEFQEDESIRLLPKCSHAFHVYCIDTWLKTHSNCPLCRANVCVEVKDSPPISLPPPLPLPPPPLAMTSELGEREGGRRIIRSRSMGYLCQARVLITQDMARQEVRFQGDNQSVEKVLKGNINGLNFVNVNHFGMTRSYSSGRFLFTKEGG